MAEMKIYKCTCCGIDVEATKFASAPKIKCEECKISGREVDQSIIDEIMANKKSRTKTKDSTKIVGDMKESKCIVCGADTLITKFGSHKKALCDNCKGTKVSHVHEVNGELPRIDLSKIDRSKLPNIDDLSIMPQVIRNKSLREVTCPACEGQKHMRIVKIIDGGERGLVIHYQCDNETCLTIITLSEQARVKTVSTGSSEMFNYRGEVIDTLISSLGDSRQKNIMEIMKRKLDENGIALDGVDVPEFLTKYDMKKHNMIIKGYDNVEFVEKEKNNGGNEDS